MKKQDEEFAGEEPEEYEAGLEEEYIDEETDTSWFDDNKGKVRKESHKQDEKYRIMAGIMTVAVCIIIVSVIVILVVRISKNTGGEQYSDIVATESTETEATLLPEASVPQTLPQESAAVPSVPESVPEQDQIMAFEAADETVTAKELTNLRTVPSMDSQDTVAVQLKNGQTAKRTGINQDTGWSRVEYDGQVLYAVSRYLTTDLDKPAGTGTSTGESTANTGNTASTGQIIVSEDGNSVTTKDGNVVEFTDADDQISPKMEVNLRLEPSTSEGNATIHARLKYGEAVHRTGISEASGWSRVEYDGKTLYTITSYIFVVEPANE